MSSLENKNHGQAEFKLLFNLITNYKTSNSRYPNFLEIVIPTLSSAKSEIDYVPTISKIYNSLDNKNNFLYRIALYSSKENIINVKKLYEYYYTIEKNDDDENRKQVLFLIFLLDQSKIIDTSWYNREFNNLQLVQILSSGDNTSYNIYKYLSSKLNNVNYEENLLELANKYEKINANITSYLYLLALDLVSIRIDSEENKEEYLNYSFLSKISDQACNEENITELHDNNIEKISSIILEKDDNLKEFIKKITENIERILKSSDSELRKNIIVMLHNGNYQFLKIYPPLDEAFIKGEPRTLAFGNIEIYHGNSLIIKEYETLSEHSYLYDESQPTLEWPLKPYKDTSKTYLDKKAQKWREYIEQYPYHPSADDAALHLGLIFYNLGEHKKSFNLAVEFLTRPTLDQNAFPRLKALVLANIETLDDKDLPNDFITVKKIRHIVECLYDQQCALPNQISLKNLQNNKNLMKIFYLSYEDISKLLDLLKLSKEKIINSAKKDALTLDLLYKLSDINYPDEYGVCENSNSYCNLNYKPLYSSDHFLLNANQNNILAKKIGKRPSAKLLEKINNKDG